MGERLVVFSWMARSRYRKEVLAQTLAILFDPSLKPLLDSGYPQLGSFIRQNFKDGISAAETAVAFACVVLTNAIEKLAPASKRRSQIGRDLKSWLAQPDGFTNVKAQAASASTPNGTDPILWRLQWAFAYIADLRGTKSVSEQCVEQFRSEVIGALEGIDSEARESGRLSSVLHRAFKLPVLGNDADPVFLPATLDAQEPDGLAGNQWDVRLIPTATGISIELEDGSGPVTAWRSLTQEDLAKVPQGDDPYVLVNFKDVSGEIHSCIISGADAKIFGSQKAFWWSMAKANVVVTNTRLRATRMSADAFARVYNTARGMWDAAIEKEGSIDHMRDLFVLLRNVHLEVISKMKENEPSPEGKLGFDIALAMVLATQAGDPNLEKFAFENFKRFLWHSGEEPIEFLKRDAS